MDTIRIIALFRCTFVSSTLDMFTVVAEDVGKEIDAPAWIQETVVFSAMVKDGYLIVVPVNEKTGDAIMNPENSEEIPSVSPQENEEQPSDVKGEEIVEQTEKVAKSPVIAEVEVVDQLPKRSSRKKTETKDDEN